MKNQNIRKVSVITIIIAYLYLMIAPHLLMHFSSNIALILITSSFLPLIVGGVLLNASAKTKDKISIALSFVTLLSPITIFGLYFLFH